MLWRIWNMKRSCFVKWVLVLISSVAFAGTQKSAIVYYGSDISWPMVGVHDFIILEPSHVDIYTHGFQRYRKRIYAYVSIGEVKKERPWYKQLKKEWHTGRNSVWKGAVMDLANPKYRRFMMQKVIDPLFAKGFQNLFLDTVDVCDRLEDPQKQNSCREGSVALIKEIKKRHPHAGLIINRGFHIFNQVKDDVDAVLFESYYRGLKGKKYVKVSYSDRKWLDRQLEPIKRAGIPVIALDYLENPHSKEADEVSDRLKKRGFIPYISDKNLHRYGHTVYNVVKRELLMIFNGAKYGAPYSAAHIVTAMPVEYQGYIPILYDIQKGLPSGHLEDRFAGVVFEVDRSEADGKKVVDWILKYAHRGLKSMVVGDVFPFGMSNDYYTPLGVELHKTECSAQDPKRLIANKGFFFEMKVPLHDEDTYFILRDKRAEPLLSYKNACGESNTLAAKTWWGGYVAKQSWLIQYGDDVIWIANPFKIFKQILDLKPMPIPDPTTENGLRILITHLDGDGMYNLAEWNGEFAGQVILDEILKKYPIPHSISVVGGEIMPNGIAPQYSKDMIRISKEIFALPNVEPASHTFSHPFKWFRIDKNGDLAPQYRMDIPGYKFNLDFELSGFINYINKHLVPKNRPKAKTIFWSGDCVPGDDVVANVYHHHLLNINGGDTYITKDHPWLSYIAPFGLRHGNYWQIYTGQQNENVYTDHFTHPIWGYVRAIQTFQLTDAPRRFKPIDVYYHFYSGSKRAALNSLKKVFNWALKQPTIPLYTTEFIKKVMDFYAASLAKNENGKWLAAGLDDIRTIRWEGYRQPNLSTSQGCVGYEQERNVTYLHFDGRDRVAFSFMNKKPTWSLVKANGRIKEFIKKQRGAQIVLKAHVPLKIKMKRDRRCRITVNPKPNIRKTTKDELLFQYKKVKEATIDVICH